MPSRAVSSLLSCIEMACCAASIGIKKGVFKNDLNTMLQLALLQFITGNGWEKGADIGAFHNSAHHESRCPLDSGNVLRSFLRAAVSGSRWKYYKRHKLDEWGGRAARELLYGNEIDNLMCTSLPLRRPSRGVACWT